MIKRFLKIYFVFCLLFVTGHGLFAQKAFEKQIGDSLHAFANRIADVGRVSVNSISVNHKSKLVVIKASSRLAAMPMRPENVDSLYNMLKVLLSSRYKNYKIKCQSNNQSIEDLIPNNFRIAGIDNSRIFNIKKNNPALVTNLSRTYSVDKGLDGRHIAVWQSHGRYYNQEKSKWIWQRARLFQTVEDLYTQSYVLSFLVPMLENAGANVLIPRERDTQIHEVIVDNDKSILNTSQYHRINNGHHWQSDTLGFAHLKQYYIDGENPFEDGTYEYASTTTDSTSASRVEWIPNIEEKGKYAVYVSYKSIENSSKDARYSIYHLGGKTHFSVNQTISGSTWVYLGMFSFPEGRNRDFRVELSNFSSEKGRFVTADAVKIGGGMGNIARSPLIIEEELDKNTTSETILDTIIPQISNFPRFTEGARYWLQWAGLPDSIYSRTEGENDYTDDYQSRGFWMKHLIGGSVLAPKRSGFAVPVDLALAFHSDAGNTKSDTIVGTLAIYSSINTLKESVFENGISRMAARDLTDLIQTQIVDDLRRFYDKNWVRRGLWDKSYSESREPEVPTILLELLSHQNLADMRYGLDPRFKFTVSRAIYKAMLKYIAYNNNEKYIVQPLPVEQFSSRFVSKEEVELQWESVVDSIEPTAKANRYIVYTRVDNKDFDEGFVVDTNSIVFPIVPGKIYSFKVAALNDGGKSFPSEIISVCRSKKDKGEVLIVNGFDRVSGPGFFRMNNKVAGINDDADFGVPYLSDISYTGKQYDFIVDNDWISDDEPGFGASDSTYETQVIAGNRFDYPYVHGRAIKAAGYSFVSSSLKSILNSKIKLEDYRYLDIILGKQKQTSLGIFENNTEFKTFPLALQKSLKTYCDAGGNLMISGAFVVSDFLTKSTVDAEEKQFIESVLKINTKTVTTVSTSTVEILRNTDKNSTEFEIYDKPNEHEYFVESVNGFEAISDKAFLFSRYKDLNIGSAVGFSGKYKIITFGFPFEVIKSENDREKVMKTVFEFLSSTPK